MVRMRPSVISSCHYFCGFVVWDNGLYKFHPEVIYTMAHHVEDDHLERDPSESPVIRGSAFCSVSQVIYFFSSHTPVRIMMSWWSGGEKEKKWFSWESHEKQSLMLNFCQERERERSCCITTSCLPIIIRSISSSCVWFHLLLENQLGSSSSSAAASYHLLWGDEKIVMMFCRHDVVWSGGRWWEDEKK